MGISANAYAAVRGNARRTYAGSSAPQEADINRGADLLVSQGLPPHTSIVSMGGSWVVQVQTGDAVKPASAVPTTAADLQLYNSSPLGSGVCAVIDSVFFICELSEAAAEFYTVLGQIVGPGVAAAPSAYTSVVSSLNGKGTNYSGPMVRGLSVTTAVANQWFAFGSAVNTQALTATAGLTADWDCFGKYIVPPTASFFVTGIGSVHATGKLCVGIRWHEITLDLG